MAFFDFCNLNIKNVDFVSTSHQDYEKKKIELEYRLINAKTISGTQKFHFFKPISEYKVEVRRLSSSTKSSERDVTVMKSKHLDSRFVNGYVTVMYDSKCWLGYALEKDEREEAKIKFLIPLHLLNIQIKMMY